MLRKLFTVVFLAAVSLTTLVATGCASNADRPDALTGQRPTYNDNWRYTDDKGRYHPEWRANPPVGYPKGRGASGS
jgi:hypothetical protein